MCLAMTVTNSGIGGGLLALGGVITGGAGSIAYRTREKIKGFFRRKNKSDSSKNLR